MPPKQKNGRKKAKRVETNIICDPKLRKFDVLDFIAEKMGRRLIVHRRIANSDKLAASDQFEVSASFSGIPFAIIGCKGVGPNYKIAEDNAAYNFVTFFENYSLPGSCLHNIRRYWIGAVADISHLITVCNLLVKELACAEYSTVNWASSDSHFTPSTDKSYAKQLKTIVKVRLEGKKNAPGSLKRKCDEIPSTSSGSTHSEPDPKRLKVEASASVISIDSDVICIDESADEDSEIISSSVTYTLSDDSVGITLNASSSSVGQSISHALDRGDAKNGVANGVVTLPENYEYHLIGVEYSGDMLADIDIQNYVRRHREASDKFSEDIWTHYKNNGQNAEVYAWKMQVRELLLNEIQTIFPRQVLQLYAVGSTVNGCGSYNSDMDLCLCIPDEGTSNIFNENRNLALKYLKKISDAMYRIPRLKRAVCKAKLIRAKVPILKVDMRPPYSELDLDININNVPGIYNSHLIHYYSLVDPRFPAIALLIKHWAISNGISDALNGTFNSYSLILLLIHYLQCGVKPAVLPNLQFLVPTKFSDMPRLDQLSLFEQLHGIPERPVNLATVGELLIGFFRYYAKFDFQTWAISIRNARRFPRRDLPIETSQFAMFIEEPFDGKNTARCIREMELIDSAFQKASGKFKNQPPDLKNIKVSV